MHDVHGAVHVIGSYISAKEYRTALFFPLTKDLGEVLLIGNSFNLFEVFFDRGSTQFIAGSTIHCLLVKNGNAILVSTLFLRFTGKLFYDVADLLDRAFAEDIKRTITAMGSRKRIVFHPTAIGEKIKIFGRVYGCV